MSLEGTLLGKYRILSHLGEGGMGSVYRARDEMLDRDVAIKVLRPDLAGNASLGERFRSEAIALARLAHPRIAILHGLERDGAQLLMVMEYLPGETLEALILRTGGVPWRRAAQYCAAVCEALDHAHEHGVVHRDIKPANIMVSHAGTIKVMDFGIARVVGRSRQTQTGRSVGTPTYMAPEQLRGEEVDGRADIYALGAVFYELITGKLAFDADSDYSLMMKQLNDPPPRAGLSVADLPEAVDEIVTRAMAKRPEGRFADAAEMRAALDAVVRAGPARDESAPRAKPRPVPVTRLAADPPAPPPGVSPPVPAPPPAQRPPPPTRLAPEPATPSRSLPHPAPAHPGPAASAAASGVARWMRDWRAWTGLAAVLIVTVIALKAGGAPPLPQAAPQPAPAPVPAPPPPAPPPSAAQQVQPQAPPPAPKPPAPDPRLIGARPLPVGGEAPPARSDPAPVAPNRNEVGTREATPAPPPPPEVPDGAAVRSAITGAVTGWLAAIGTRDVGRMSALSPEPKPHAQLLELMRGGRVSLAGQEAPGIEVTEGAATATVSTTLSYRTAFGAGRKTPVRFALELTQAGAAWRVTRARIVGTPRLD